MKILLAADYTNIEPLGLLYLSSAMKKNNDKVDLMLFDNTNIGGFDYNYDIVGYSTYTGGHKKVYDLCSDREITVAIGGPHATYFTDDCKKYANYVFRGEALLSLPRLDDKKIYPLVPAKDIPLPDRKLLYKNYPEFKAKSVKRMFAGFGCPYNCTYCFNSQYKAMYQNYKIRLREIDSILEEANNIDAEVIFFQDDCFGFNLMWLEKFAEKWRRPYHCQIRLDYLTDEHLKLFKKSGCISLTTAIESASQNIRKNLLGREELTNEEIIKRCKRIKDFGIKLKTEQMLGLPNTLIKDDLNTLEINIEIQPTLAWTSIYQPYLGTPLASYCIKKGYYKGNNDDIDGTFFTKSVLNFSEGHKKQIEKLQNVFNIAIYIPNGLSYAKKFITTVSDADNELFKRIFGKQASIKDHLIEELYDKELYL